MDINEDLFKQEVNSFVSSLQRMLPKKKDIIAVVQPPKRKLCRLANVHAEAKKVFPRCFYGAKLEILREIIDKVKLSQQYSYGNPNETHQCFTNLLYKEMEPKKLKQMLVLDTSAQATATYREVLEDGYEMLLTSKIIDLATTEAELVLEKNESTYYGAVTCAIKDVDPETTKIVSQWMQQILPELSVGCEVGFRPFCHPPYPEVSVSARYEKPAFTISATVSKMGFQICSYKKFAEDLQLAGILNEGNDGSPTFGIALNKLFLNGSDLKMFVDNNLCGGMTYQKDVYVRENLAEVRVLRITASSLIDRQKIFRFGLGFNIDL